MAPVPLGSSARLAHWASVAGGDLLLRVARSTAPEGPDVRAELARLAEEAEACTACPLARGRRQAVFADGSADARILFVGEGPGAEEDRLGKPFVGRAGRLLTRIIENAMGLPRAEVYICNIVKCRPPGNRNPTPAEQQACGRFLEAQIRLVRPDILIPLGKVAAQYLLDSDESMTRLRGRVLDYDGIPVVPTWHPAYLLRSPAAKRDTWNDVKLALRTLGLPETPPPYRGARTQARDGGLCADSPFDPTRPAG